MGSAGRPRGKNTGAARAEPHAHDRLAVGRLPDEIVVLVLLAVDARIGYACAEGAAAGSRSTRQERERERGGKPKVGKREGRTHQQYGSHKLPPPAAGGPRARAPPLRPRLRPRPRPQHPRRLLRASGNGLKSEEGERGGETNPTHPPSAAASAAAHAPLIAPVVGKKSAIPVSWRRSVPPSGEPPWPDIPSRVPAPVLAENKDAGTRAR